MSSSQSHPIRPRFAVGALAGLSLAALVLASSASFGADLGGQPVVEVDTKPNLWLVTIGGFATIEPKFDGSNKLEPGFRPVFGFRKAGSREWMTLPNDGIDFEVIETDNFRAGPVANLRWVRDKDNSRGFGQVGGTEVSFEAGAFAEYWPAQWFRTRVEVRNAFINGDGIVADFTADAVWRPTAAWRLTAGPRLSLANKDYMNSNFGVGSDEAFAAGLPTYKASGGIESYGAGASAQYKWSEAWTSTGFVEYQRLAGSAADSPLLKDGGSPNQLSVGIGLTYTFAIGHR